MGIIKSYTSSFGAGPFWRSCVTVAVIGTRCLEKWVQKQNPGLKCTIRFISNVPLFYQHNRKKTSRFTGQLGWALVPVTTTGTKDCMGEFLSNAFHIKPVWATFNKTFLNFWKEKKNNRIPQHCPIIQQIQYSTSYTARLIPKFWSWKRKTTSHCSTQLGH